MGTAIAVLSKSYIMQQGQKNENQDEGQKSHSLAVIHCFARVTDVIFFKNGNKCNLDPKNRFSEHIFFSQ